MAMAMRPRQVPPLLAAALERARPGGTLARVELHALSEPEARDLLGKEVDEATARRLYADCGGNPFYLEQLARHGGSAGRERRRGHARRARRPAGGRRVAGRGARAAGPRGAPGAGGRGGGRRPVRARARRRGGGRVRRRGDRGARRAVRARPDPPDRRPAPLPLPPPARARRRLRRGARPAGGSAPTSAAPRRWPRAARRRPRGRTTSSTRPATATPRRSPSWRKRAGRSCIAPRPGRRAGSPPRCGCCPPAPPPRSGSGCCWRSPGRSGRPAASTRRATPSSRASRSRRAMPPASAWS